IRLDGVSVRYRVPRERIPSFKEYAIRWLRREIAYHDFWALKDVSLEVRRGEVFGIIGHNGAGKSTLLKVIARVLRPTTGRVRVWGRVAPLLELGAGFDSELTGRENVFLNSAILGFSRRETEARFDRIVEFAGIREFIDMPLRTYSSGMIARLGFAVATDVQPEILIVDEVLAVGDAEFQAKSFERIRQFRANGTTILMVSHNLAAVQSLCARAAWLHHGQCLKVDTASEVVAAYLGQ
ncbi:MAG: ABC transporter ATP-binding protein, partial [Gemmatales bacterium]|nr:ABC transporter ATP-binding protein [Gemmatales bacterium]